MLRCFNIMIPSLITFMVIGISCQSSDEPEILQEASRSLTKNSRLVHDLINVSISKGFKDDILDDFPHAKTIFPVNIRVNEQSFTIAGPNGFQIIKAVKDVFSTDDDIVHFGYPITLKFNDYSEKVLENKNQFDLLREEYLNTSVNGGIVCVRLIYPIDLMFFNEVSGDSGIKVIESDQQLYEVLNNLLASDLIEIKYPVSLKIAGNRDNIISVYDNEGLSNMINNAPYDCPPPGINEPCKVKICHISSENPASAMLTEVGCEVLEAHLAHGDIIGHCI